MNYFKNSTCRKDMAKKYIMFVVGLCTSFEMKKPVFKANPVWKKNGFKNSEKNQKFPKRNLKFGFKTGFKIKNRFYQKIRFQKTQTGFDILNRF